jgi:hypothetical protein
MFNRDVFKDYSRADAANREEVRNRLRVAALESQRNAESRGIIQAPGEGCACCVDGAKSVSMADQIDICRAVAEAGSYLPIYMDIKNQRPAWCPGFNQNGNGVAAADPIIQQTEQQEELPL